jgi:hypothetical protein
MGKLFKWAALVVVLASTAGVYVHAQERWTPPSGRPALSPWLDMFRADPGPLPNYHQFVRPRQELRRTLDRQASVIQTQGAALRGLSQELPLTVRGGGMSPTGVGGSFLNYSHFYSGLGGGPRR